MTESLIVVRLTRNLKYKLTYIHIFTKYLEAAPESEISGLLTQLLEAQRAAIGPLSRYLRHHDVAVQDVELDEKLLSHAFGRTDVRAQLRFIYDGLRRAVAWYKTQLTDKQMAVDEEVIALLFELGEIDASKLWRTEALMGMLHVPTTSKTKEWDEPQQQQSRSQQIDEQEWRPRLADDVGRPVWRGSTRTGSDRTRSSRYGPDTRRRTYEE